MLQFLGSLKTAVFLLLAIATVLAYGTFYEARFGTQASARFVYHSVWFQLLLAFLAVNLAAAAWRRFPWQRKHIPFVMAHIGIILTLIGGILGGRFGIEGQLVIPEGDTANLLQLHHNVLVVHQPNPGIHREFPTHFDATAWIDRPHALFEVPLAGKSLQLVVDRYYPDALLREEVTGDGQRENPAIQLVISHEGHEQGLWLFGRDPDRFGARFGNAHIFFLAPRDQKQLRQLLGQSRQVRWPRLSIVVVRRPEGKLLAFLVGEDGREKRIDPLQRGTLYSHPGLGIQFKVAADLPKASILSHYTKRSNEVRQEAIHLTLQDGGELHEGWIPLRGSLALPVENQHPILVEYRPAMKELTVSIKLLDFRKIDYPGTQMAAGFESDVEVSDPARGLTFQRTIRMNNPLKVLGYTFFQSSYIPSFPGDSHDGAGPGPRETTVLAVRNDPGVPLVYGGFLFIIAGVITMFIFRKPELMLLPLLLGLGPMAFAAQEESQAQQIVVEQLEELRYRAVLHLGRIKPLDSFARETLKRLTGKERLGHQDPVATILSVTSEPQRWQESRILSVPFIPLRQALDLSEKTTHISYEELIAGRKLMPLLPPIVGKQSRDEKLSMLENEVMDLYDRFVTLDSLLKGEIPFIQEQSAPAGAPGELGPSSNLHWRLRLEVLYNRLYPFRIARIFYFVAAALLLLFSVNKGRTKMALFGMAALWAAFSLHGAGIAARVILGERPPVSNFYETMLWLPFVGVGLALLFERVYRGAGIFGFAGATLSAAALLLADHVPLDPSISPVVAVLRSNLWLTVHVLTIVGSYAPLAVAMVLSHLYGVLYLARGEGHPAFPSLDLFLYRLIQVGVVLLAAGIMLGAVWANASWGRYWGWDPKETWALITLLWFLAILHGRFAGWLKGVWVALGVIAGFFLVLMTYYGVSFYLVGLHSYAGGHAKPLPPLLAAYFLAEAAFIGAVGLVAFQRRQAARSSGVVS